MDKKLRSYSEKRQTHCVKVGQNLGVQIGTPRLEILQNEHLGGPQFLFPSQFLNKSRKLRPQDPSKVWHSDLSCWSQFLVQMVPTKLMYSLTCWRACPPSVSWSPGAGLDSRSISVHCWTSPWCTWPPSSPGWARPTPTTRTTSTTASWWKVGYHENIVRELKNDQWN